jgi:tetratricopeptide (TPR) repeat protein
VRTRVVAALALCVAAACSHDADPAAARAPEVHAAPRLAVRTPRSADPDAAGLRRSIERGRVDEAHAREAVLARLDPGEARVLAARLSAISGRIVDAIREIEAARKERPADPDVYATAAEIYAAAGKARRRMGRGESRRCRPADRRRSSCARAASCGSRARGGRARASDSSRTRAAPMRSCRSSTARSRRRTSSSARRIPPRTSRRRARARTLRGVARSRRRRRAALPVGGPRPERRLRARGRGDQTLVDRGEPLVSELALLHKKAGIAALLEHDRERALRHFVSARKLGLTDAELATGARLLGEEAAAKVGLGVEAYKAGDLATAKARSKEALELEPDGIQAQNLLAVVLFKESDYAGAIALWRVVLETAQKEDLALPEPVHLNLARAQELSGDAAAARTTLEAYLARDPSGPWVADTRAALALLPPKKTGD